MEGRGTVKADLVALMFLQQPKVGVGFSHTQAYMGEYMACVNSTALTIVG